MTMKATVRDLWLHGFEIGPHPFEGCMRCAESWGDHILFAPGAPVDGGWFACAEATCLCEGTWYTTAKGVAPDETTGP